MMTAGSWAAYEWLVLGGKGIVFKAGGFLTLFGIYLFWIDFLSPDRERAMTHPERPSEHQRNNDNRVRVATMVGAIDGQL